MSDGIETMVEIGWSTFTADSLVPVSFVSWSILLREQVIHLKKNSAKKTQIHMMLSSRREKCEREKKEETYAVQWPWKIDPLFAPAKGKI